MKISSAQRVGMGQSDAYVRCPLRGPLLGALSYDVRFLLFVLIALAAIAVMTLTAAFFTASRNAVPDWRQGAPLETPNLNGPDFLKTESPKTENSPS